MYLEIENKGEIPETGIRLIGYSTKNEKQIGQFGTGLKEGIALLLREGKNIIICSGLRKYTFCYEGDPKEIIYTWDDYETTQTCRMNLSANFGARDWTDTWQAVREFVCNALDEKDYAFKLTEKIIPEEGKTKIYLSGCNKVFYELEDKILRLGNRKPLAFCEEGAIYDGRGCIYHKGIWVRDVEDCIFDVDLPHLKLTESRTSEDLYVRADFWTLMKGISDIEVWAKFYRRLLENKSYEKMLLMYYNYHVPTSVVNHHEACSRAFGDNYIFCNDATYNEILGDYRKIIVNDSETLRYFTKAGCTTHFSVIADKDGYIVNNKLVVDYTLWDKISNKTPPVIKYYSGGSEVIKRKGEFLVPESEYNNNILLLEIFSEYMYPKMGTPSLYVLKKVLDYESNDD